jgi:hypothetical protein
VLSKFKSTISELGFFTAIAYFIHRLLSNIGSNSGLFFYYFYDQPLESKTIVAPRKKVFDFYWANDVDDKIANLPRPKDVLDTRFASGSHCMVAKKVETDEFLGCAWFAYNRYQEDEVNCIYEFSNSNKVWDYDVYVKPELRMSRLFLRLWQQASNSLSQKGYNSSLSRISAYNVQSIKSHEKFGAKRIGWSMFLTLIDVQVMLSSKAPFVGLSYKKHGQPILSFK